ncbi:hypothetical protein K438DRAFT_1850798 [Mycena galopus ATCC 62051]|nr:hypothetical protein K438DRAFT_1850798 [Mycena galopus ATCC 62051]
MKTLHGLSMSVSVPGQGSEVTGAVAIPSGLHRFPAELLVEIFALCWQSFTPHFDDVAPAAPPGEPENFPVFEYKTEIARVAHAPLLVVASVCSRWRAIAMGTPFLWCDIEVDSLLLGTPSHIEAVLDLLRSVLTRGGTLPLHLTLAQYDDYIFPNPILELLVVHSERWQKLSCPSSCLGAFSACRGKLPRLQNLTIDLSEDVLGVRGPLDMLDALPSLTYLSFPAMYLPNNMAKLPLEHLTGFEATTVTLKYTDKVLALMSRLPKATELHLIVYLMDDAEEWLGIECRPQNSSVSTFEIEFMLESVLDRSQAALASIFRNLTLPLLKKLQLEAEYYPPCTILWPHAEFLALSARSDFDSHLTSLEIYEVHITEEQLLECLSSLHSLERLAISDHQIIDSAGGNEFLITDHFFAQLTLIPDSPCIVPRLSFLSCGTLSQFDDRVLLALAVSRLDQSHGCRNGGHFGLKLSWLPGHERDIDDEVFAHFRELIMSTGGRLTFKMSAEFDEEV